MGAPFFLHIFPQIGKTTIIPLEKDGIVMNIQKITGDFQAGVQALDQLLRVEKSFDIITRDMTIGNRQSRMYMIDGFVKDDIMEKIMEFLMSLPAEQAAQPPDVKTFADQFLPYVEVALCADLQQISIQILSGTIALLIEGCDQAVMVDARTYPARGVSEPEADKVLRGSHDGFVETLVMNTALIRRRIRDPRLTMEILQVGDVSHTDIVLCYMEGVAPPKFVETVRKKVSSISIKTMTLSQESLAECLMKRQWYNPFPRVRYTERPDTASACLAEGKVVVLIDNSPAAMLMPAAIFDFVQDTNDFYFPPLVGTYLRLVRIVIFFLTLMFTPTWFLLIQNPQWIPTWLGFIQVQEPNSIPIIFQLLAIEFVVDGLKLASLNTPSALSNSFSVVAALVLGDFAVQAGLFVPEVVLYMAFVAILNFTQPSFELGYAFKLCRVLILILTALFNLWGFLGGILVMVLLIATTRTISGKSYLYPLIPFCWGEFKKLFIREPISRRNT